MPDLFKFKTPTNAAAKVHPIPKPKPRAFLIAYHHNSMKKLIALEKERYEREGYEVKTSFLYPPKSITGKPTKNYKQPEPGQTVRDRIAWLKASDNSLLSFSPKNSL